MLMKNHGVNPFDLTLLIKIQIYTSISEVTICLNCLWERSTAPSSHFSISMLLLQYRNQLPRLRHASQFWRVNFGDKDVCVICENKVYKSNPTVWTKIYINISKPFGWVTDVQYNKIFTLRLYKIYCHHSSLFIGLSYELQFYFPSTVTSRILFCHIKWYIILFIFALIVLSLCGERTEDKCQNMALPDVIYGHVDLKYLSASPKYVFNLISALNLEFSTCIV